MTSLRSTLLLLSFLFLCGCPGHPGTDTGNPTAVGVKFIGVGGTDGGALKLQSAGATITEARVVLKEIDLDPIASCQNENENADAAIGDEPPDLPGPFVVDLLENTSIPDTNTFTIRSGLYCELDMNFDLLENDVPAGIAADDPIIGNAFLIRGTRGDGTPFVARLNQDDRFKLEASSAAGFIVKNGSFTGFFVRFDLGAWFDGVDLEKAAVTEGTILLDGANNPGLKALLVENIKHSAFLFQDLNDDGALDAEESDDSLILGVGTDEPD